MVEQQSEPIEAVIDIEKESDDEEVIPLRYSITSYGADYPVDGLVKRIKDQSIRIPIFQRGFVWNITTASRFIESLLLGLPVPGIFLSKDTESQRLIVIDGQQRLRTLQYFYQGVFADTGREFALTGVQEQFKGITYETLSAEDQRSLDDSILHATIVKQDEPEDGNSSVYLIFERLNTGGVQLQSQEIRTAIFHGSFSQLLNKLNANSDWRELFGKTDKRMRDQELILRFLALFFERDNYSKPIKGFLNSFMDRNRTLEKYTEVEITQVFTDTVQAIRESIGSKAFKPSNSFRAALFDAVMVGVAERLTQKQIYHSEQLKTQYDSLLLNADFVAATETSTSDENNVKLRLRLAAEAFQQVD